MEIRAWVMLLVLAVLPAAGIEPGDPPAPGMADLDSGSGLLTLAADPRIRFEAGALPLAQITAIHLNAAVARVEQEHGRPFLVPVTIVICATERSFIRLSSDALAVTRNAKVILSPRLFEEPDRVPGILTHELSHAHFAQYLGPAAANLPRWFLEGVAVQVSAGAGAKRVSRDEARQAILAGRQLSPTTTDEDSDAALAPAMFYRQATMFVGYLQSNPQRFRQLLDAVLDGVPFGIAFERSYNAAPAQIWRRFVAKLDGGRR